MLLAIMTENDKLLGLGQWQDKANIESTASILYVSIPIHIPFNVVYYHELILTKCTIALDARI